MDRNLRWEKFTISNLTNILTFTIALVNILDIILNISYPAFQIQLLFTDLWWQIFLFPFRITKDLLSLIFFLYVFWTFGNTLEQEMGSPKFNLYVFSGYLFIIIGTFFYPIDAYFVYLSIFFALAYLYPDMEILFFFLIPIKMKWIGIITVLLIVFQAISFSLSSGSILPILSILFGNLNFIIFILIPSLKIRHRLR
ncbi:MAG: hypothetical protein NZ853_00920 [Leptospiraceae bacterium]|nr:hypothetical protein [Leptospiraceae bacterium]MDW7976209.1 hypothetical protein [Leptospiraceae bacterium]